MYAGGRGPGDLGKNARKTQSQQARLAHQTESDPLDGTIFKTGKKNECEKKNPRRDEKRKKRGQTWKCGHPKGENKNKTGTWSFGPALWDVLGFGD